MNLKNMSAMNRYKALNNRILHVREGAPLSIDIQGQERLQFQKEHIMLESVTTSLQVHFQVDLYWETGFG